MRLSLTQTRLENDSPSRGRKRFLKELHRVLLSPRRLENDSPSRGRKLWNILTTHHSHHQSLENDSPSRGRKLVLQSAKVVNTSFRK